jgi:hypothetical protein
MSTPMSVTIIAFFGGTSRPLDIPGEHAAVSGPPKPPAGAAIGAST